MDVRLARPTDAPLLLALALDEESQLVKSSNGPATGPVARTLLKAAFPLAFAGRMWVALEDGDVALLQAQPRQYAIAWDVTRLAARGDRDRVLPLVVKAVTDYLQSRGVPRLFARCGERASEDLKPLGFYPLAREYLLSMASHRGAADSPLPIESRYRMPQDAWPLHQLESEVTPAMVRQIEGLTSLDWARDVRGTSQIVVERDGRVVAWIGWTARPGKGHTQIGLLVRPNEKDLGAALLNHVLGQIAEGSCCTARVREYQVDTLNVFLDAGFTITAEEFLMVKHAGVEPARVARRLRVSQVPSMQGFRSQIETAGVGLRGAILIQPIQKDNQS